MKMMENPYVTGVISPYGVVAVIVAVVIAVVVAVIVVIAVTILITPTLFREVQWVNVGNYWF